MEDSKYEALKTSLSNIPVKALSKDCHEILSKNLDIKQPVPSECGYPRDFRGLAELMGIPHLESKKIEEYKDRTLKILKARPNAKLGDLIDYLEKIQRVDVIKELIPLLDKQVETFRRFKKDSAVSVQVSGEDGAEAVSQSQRVREISVPNDETNDCPMRSQDKGDLLTRQDLRTGECTSFDAYVCYADEDSEFVQDLANFLETEIGLKLFIRGRDMLVGSKELDTDIELIKNRCRRMLIILTENFIHSSQCAFQISFATSLSIDQKERILVPILISPCDVPDVLLIVSKIDFTKPKIYEWMWDRLIMSLLPQRRMFIPSRTKLPAQPYRSPSPEPVAPRKSPVITFPETVKLSPIPTDQISSRLFTSVVIPVERSSNVSVSNQSQGELVEPESLLNDSTSAKVVMADNRCVITVPKTVQGLAQPVTESAAATKSNRKSSPKTSHIVSEKIPVTQKIRNAFRSYFRKEPSVSNSSSYLSNVTSGYHSESTFVTN